MRTAPAFEQPRLLRRLLIRCPASGLPTDTGFDLSEVPSLVRGRQLLVDCLECGQDHEWGVDELVVPRPIGLAGVGRSTHV
jgi:hypothetical protein